MKLVPIFVSAVLFCSALAAWAAPIAELTSDKAAYEIGESAAFRVHLMALPVHRDLEFFVELLGQNNTMIPLVAAEIEGDFLGESPPFEAIGVYDFVATIYLQNIKIAAALNGAIDFYRARVQAIDAQIPGITNPEDLARILAERQENINKLQASERELAKHRVPVNEPVLLSLQVQ